MRVLEAKPVATQTMGKRKHKLHKKSQDNEGGASDSSDELVTLVVPGASGGTCPHISKAVNLNTTRKALRQQHQVGECTSCERQKSKAHDHADSASVSEAGGDAISEGLSESAETTVWVCLQCGHQGCDRNSKEKHALRHYGTPRSTSHALVVNTTTWSVWCYACDDDVTRNGSRKLYECVDFVRKQASAPRTEPLPVSSSKRGGLSRQESLENTSAREEKGKSANQSNTQASQVGLPLVLPKVKGLNNLGNTCFFNAVLQNLSQTPGLESMISEWCKKGVQVSLPGSLPEALSEEESNSEGEEEEESNFSNMQLEALNISLGDAGQLTQSVLSFLRDMNAPTKNSTLSPSLLFGQICRKAPRFKGFQQQDSHELLRYLLDGMKADEIKRWQVGILKAFHLPENVQPKKVDEETRAKIKVYGRQVKHTFVDCIFGGYFISTVLCEECRIPSQIFEPFQDVSLPITEDKPCRPNVLGIRKKEGTTESRGNPLQHQSHTEKSSKHMSKKAKRQARKEAKKKALIGKNKMSPDQEESGGEEDESIPDTTPDIPSVNQAKLSADAKDDSVSVDYSDSKSDAEYSDVEDNDESDVSRVHSNITGKQEGNTASIQISKDTISCSKCNHCLSKHVENCNGLGNGSEAGSSHETLCDKGSGSTLDVKPAETIPEDDLTSKMQNLDISDRQQHTPVEENNAVIGSCDSCCKTDVNDVHAHRCKEKSLLKIKLEAQLLAMNSLAPRAHVTSHECSILSCLNQFTSAELLTGSNKFGCEHCTRLQKKHQSRSSSETKQDIVYSNASKQVLIFQPPAVLTLHLKRFQQMGFTLRKVNRHVQFPIELDLAPYCSALAQGISSGCKQVLYALYGVVEHSGRLSGGHYTAYVKVRPNSERFKEFLQHKDINGIKLHRLLEVLKAEVKSPQPEPHIDEDKQEDKTGTLAGKWYYISDSRVSEVAESAVLRCQAYLLFYERIL